MVKGALTSFSNCPTEIVFLRTISPAHSLPQLGSSDIVFDILEGNLHNSFDILKRYEHGMIVGEWHSGIHLVS